MECICGLNIGGRNHHCEIPCIKKHLEFICCDENNCEKCKTSQEVEEKRRIYENQWRENADGCIFCTECDAIISAGEAYELPKNCHCKWYTDTEAIDRCKYCHEPYNYDYKDCTKPCTKCYWAWDTDYKGVWRCSFCYTDCKLLAKKACKCDEDVDSS